LSVYGGTPNPFDTQKPIPGIKRVVAVGAGKGGVGKSTVSAQLALALAKGGQKVGLLDADIYGPSVPLIFGLGDARPNLSADNKIDPITKHGIKLMSLGFLIDDGAAVIWRGPMLFKAIQQMLFDVFWGELDTLVVDLPPGTGDVQLTIAQKVPVNGAIIVSTPQDMALIDVKRCIDMFQKVKTPIIGVVENMAGLICGHCGKENQLFPKGHLASYCRENNFKLLTSIPFESAIGQNMDCGQIGETESSPRILAAIDKLADAVKSL
jgi:ATP-binding protein involved in chromosome partitioning